VGVAESARILEAEAERAIDADVGEPGEGDLDRDRAIGQDADRAEDKWQGGGVGEVVGEGATLGPARKPSSERSTAAKSPIRARTL
jgi:hypothetical protein